MPVWLSVSSICFALVFGKLTGTTNQVSNQITKNLEQAAKTNHRHMPISHNKTVVSYNIVADGFTGKQSFVWFFGNT